MNLPSLIRDELHFLLAGNSRAVLAAAISARPVHLWRPHLAAPWARDRPLSSSFTARSAAWRSDWSLRSPPNHSTRSRLRCRPTRARVRPTRATPGHARPSTALPSGLTPYPARPARPATACLCAPLPSCFLLAHPVAPPLPHLAVTPMPCRPTRATPAAAWEARSASW